MRLYLHPTAKWAAWGPTILRVIVGLVFLAHGAQKLFSFGLSNVAATMSQMGFPLPYATGTVVSLLELLGGLALIGGALTRWASLLLAIEMFVAAFFVHLPQGFFMPNGMEFALTLCAATTTLVFVGPGRYAIDEWLEQPAPAAEAIPHPKAA